MSAATSEVWQNWELMPCVPDDGPASTAAIGLIALSNDVVIESELRRFLGLPGIGIYASRVALAKEITPDNLRRMEDDIPNAVQLLVPDDKLDVIAFGCTSGTMAIGAERVARAVRTVRPGIRVADPISASIKGLNAVGARRIALLTPYPDSVNAVVADYFSFRGLNIAERGSFKQLGDPTISRVSPVDIRNAGIALSRASVDTIFISCTALRCSSAIQDIELATGKPVITSNQALAWDCLRGCGYLAPIEGFGQLFKI